ncbi:MAG: hypothetical protein GY910_03950 [bacterium]|nr:hypothetical protein [bacterium]
MSKLWIVHRNPLRLQALARLSGLAPPDLVHGGPTGNEFLAAKGSAPAAILIGAEDDFELELEFLHRHRRLLEGTRRRFVTRPEDTGEVRRLFGASPEEILESLPSERDLRAIVLSAVAHRNTETLAERRDREQIAHRFANWFGDLEIPGLLRALDPALAPLSLLVRGVPGSGRTLLARYIELFRVHGTPGPTLRLRATEITDPEELVARLLARECSDLPTIRTIWIDEIDSLGISAQRAFAEWIRLDATPTGAIGNELRWIATAGPADLTDRLEADLEHAFAPLSLPVPSLSDYPETLDPFAHRIASEWTATVGGVTRRIGSSALEALEAHAWSGDRAAVEAVLRSTLAASSRNPIEEQDLASRHASSSARSEIPGRALPETEEEIEEAVSVDTTDGDSATPANKTTLGAETSTSAHTDFEQAFLEGLPSVEPDSPPEEPAPAVATDHDVATQLSEEALAIANASTARAMEPPAAIENAPSEPQDRADAKWRRLARSLSHEIRNPLVSIRTFAELLPEHFADESFRERFTELVGRDVAHIDDVVSRLASAAEREKHEASDVDVSQLIEALLDQRRDQIGQGRLLVLRELEREAPTARVDAHTLEVALTGLLDRALTSLPERGDLFVATHRIERAADGEPRLRVLLRHHNPGLSTLDASGLEELGSAANVLEYVLAETLVESNGGTLTIDSSDTDETLILIDLPTPA